MVYSVLSNENPQHTQQFCSLLQGGWDLSLSAVATVSDVVTVEVEPHPKEAKVLIWEMDDLGQQLNYHWLYKDKREHRTSMYIRMYSYVYAPPVVSVYVPWKLTDKLDTNS